MVGDAEMGRRRAGPSEQLATGTARTDVRQPPQHPPVRHGEAVRRQEVFVFGLRARQRMEQVRRVSTTVGRLRVAAVQLRKRNPQRHRMDRFCKLRLRVNTWRASGVPPGRGLGEGPWSAAAARTRLAKALTAPTAQDQQPSVWHGWQRVSMPIAGPAAYVRPSTHPQSVYYPHRHGHQHHSRQLPYEARGDTGAAGCTACTEQICTMCGCTAGKADQGEAIKRRTQLNASASVVLVQGLRRQQRSRTRGCAAT